MITIDYHKGRTNWFNKVNLSRRGKKAIFWMCGDKLGIFTNVVSFGYMGLKFVGVF